MSDTKITAPNLIRWAGLSAVAAGIIFAAIQPIHPLDVLASVTTGPWAVVQTLKTAMCFLFLLGITGLYARQAEEAGWLGLAGFLLFNLSWALQTGFVFAEAFVLPQLATASPAFVDSFLGIVNGNPGEMAIGLLPALYTGVGILYLLGGVLFGIATFRAGVLPRWAGGLLAVGTVLPLLGSSLVAHPFDRLFAIPVGVAVAWLGYALWTERRERASAPLLGTGGPRVRPTGAK